MWPSLNAQRSTGPGRDSGTRTGTAHTLSQDSRLASLRRDDVWATGWIQSSSLPHDTNMVATKAWHSAMLSRPLPPRDLPTGPRPRYKDIWLGQSHCTFILILHSTFFSILSVGSGLCFVLSFFSRLLYIQFHTVCDSLVLQLLFF